VSQPSFRVIPWTEHVVGIATRILVTNQAGFRLVPRDVVWGCLWPRPASSVSLSALTALWLAQPLALDRSAITFPSERA
jgi:hypothetical protein